MGAGGVVVSLSQWLMGARVCWLGSFEVELECIILALDFCCACINLDMSIRVSGASRD